MKLARSLVAILAVAAFTACDEEGDDGDDFSLAGEYEVSVFEYTADDSDLEIDLAGIPAGNGGPYGITSMTVEEDHSFAGTLRLPVGGVPQNFPIGGQITADDDGDDIRIDFNTATQQLGILDPFEVGTFTLSGNTLTIILPNVTFNFHDINPGAPDEEVQADVRIVGTRS